jgi:hypothetical protein
MIVIPMAGRSQRFYDAGYTLPKYALPLDGGPVFDHAVGSFRSLFDSESFLFVAQADAEAYVRAACERLGVRRFQVVCLTEPTAGQAETVERGLDAIGAGPGEALTIFNIDTFRPGFAWPGPWFAGLAGWLEVFRGGGENWSYVRPAPGPAPLAAETAEKRPISDLCCTGLYHFARADQFRDALARERLAPQARELYVAPLYNHLIDQGLKVGWSLIAREAVVFCGTPAEYQALAGASAG